jgi:hypothetical protein
MKRERGARLLLVVAATLVALLAIEVWIRFTGLDHRFVVRVVYFQGADLPAHRVSADSFLHYELKPGAHYEGSSPNPRFYEVNIDEFGARFPTHEETKAPGTFRVLAVGGSTLYGAGVNDEETIPAALERRLRAGIRTDRATPRFEVWNFGTSAYTLGQATHLARRKLAELDPDLILVQHHNRGQRAFLGYQDPSADSVSPAQLAADPYLYAEQFYQVRVLPPAVHQALLAHWATYRTTAAAAQLFFGVRWRCDDFCNRLSADEARLLDREAAVRHVPVVYFAIPAERGAWGPDIVYPELPASRYIDLYRPDRDESFYEVHPPAPILDEYAALLLEELRARGYVPRMAPDARGG